MTVQILSIANQKGGVGKTTTSVNLSFALGTFKKKTLLVDIDPQGNASSGLGFERGSLSSSMYDVFINNVPLKNVIQKTSNEFVDIAPSDMNLAGAEVELVGMDRREYRLKKAFESIALEYDYIIMDCPPSLGLITVGALVASTGVMVPVQCEYYALEGLGHLVSSVTAIKDSLNPLLQIEGAVLTMFDGRTNLAKEVVSEVRAFFGKKIFDTIIPRNVRLAEAPSFGKSIVEYDPSSLGARAYMVLAKELISRRPLEV